MDTLPDIPDIRCLEAHGYTVHCVNDYTQNYLATCQSCIFRHSFILNPPTRRDIPLGIMLTLLNHVRDNH